MFSTYWERIPNVNYRLWYPGTPNAEAEKAQFEQQGCRLVDICGYTVQGQPQYIGVWQDLVLSTSPYVSHHGLTLAECLAKDQELKQQGYTAVKFQVFNSASQVYCTGIWEQRPGCSHRIEMDQSLAAMHRRILPDTTMVPRQISHYIDPADNCVKYAVLWSNTNSYRYPPPPPQWPQGQPIPKRYMSGSTTALDVTQIAFLERRVERFMQVENIPGLSIAITQNECLKFAAGFGWANIRKKVQLDPLHQFRIGVASVPVTAAAILLLVEQGKLTLDQKVFGPGSIFESKYGPLPQQLQQNQPFMQAQNYLCDITVRHLLEHTTGNWGTKMPIIAEPLMNNDDFIKYIAGNVPVEEMPGKQWVYSNFNYLVLAKVIECVSGQTYEQYVKSCLWSKAGVTEARVADPFISQLGPMEVMYYMTPQNGTGEGADPYVALQKERLASFGGWVASPVDLLKLMVRMDGFKNKPDILSEASIKSWSTPSLASNDTYGQGWFLNVNGWNGWVSVGRVPGASSLLVRLNTGISFVILANKEYSGMEFYHQLGYVMHHIISLCAKWETTGDLFCAQGTNC
uniref:Beta-lactamase-related domain-containing protein n=1 Tax=Plectus sambesii TaxID=2011161 RepID=A0A914UIZ1_9BILA